MAHSLTPEERETTVLTSDAEELVTIWTAQRAYITALRHSVVASETRQGWIGKTEWAEFTIPRERWTPLGIKRSVRLSDEERESRSKRFGKPRDVD